ncbi:MAG TPA: outer membrane lipoprotein-sorting protein [Candidatus Binatia bacterium]|nr:outer membrane lipoprotein-sorting protein [Candidatus Binatia bacterium]
MTKACRFALLTVLCRLGTAHGVRAEDARALLDQVKHLNETTRKWSDRTQHLQLTIVDRRANQRQRELDIYMKKYPDDASRSLVFFQAPAEIKGTGLLQWTNAHKSDEQWLFLPELKRVRQIGGGSKRESFVGTDFSYEDLAIVSQIVDWSDADAHAALVREDTVDGAPAAVIEFTPAAKDIGYGLIRTWLRRSDSIMLKYEFVDRKGAVAKTLTLTDIRAVGAIPTAFHMLMDNLQNGSHTAVDFSTVTYDSGLADDVFTQHTLERGRL